MQVLLSFFALPHPTLFDLVQWTEYLAWLASNWCWWDGGSQRKRSDPTVWGEDGRIPHSFPDRRRDDPARGTDVGADWIVPITNSWHVHSLFSRLCHGLGATGGIGFMLLFPVPTGGCSTSPRVKLWLHKNSWTLRSTTLAMLLNSPTLMNFETCSSTCLVFGISSTNRKPCLLSFGPSCKESQFLDLCTFLIWSYLNWPQFELPGLLQANRCGAVITSAMCRP